MDHVVLSADGTLPFPVSGRSAGAGRCIYLPRFDARSLTSSLPGRGFDDQLYQYPGSSYFVGVSFAEMLQRAENRITIDYTQRNAWGIPMLGIDCRHGDHELRQARDQFLALQELAKLAKVKITRIDHTPAPPGGAIPASLPPSPSGLRAGRDSIDNRDDSRGEAQRNTTEANELQ
jgi:hypothetical protein